MPWKPLMDQHGAAPRLLESVRGRLFGRHAAGRPVPRETWEREFFEGVWDWLGSLDEMGHCFVICGYLHFLGEAASQPLSILDVGCGNGQLCRYLSAVLPSFRYAGIDLSRVAIEQCNRLALQGFTFRAGASSRSASRATMPPGIPMRDTNRPEARYAAAPRARPAASSGSR